MPVRDEAESRARDWARSSRTVLRSAFYLLAGGLRKGAYLLLLPLLVSTLTPDQYTRFSVLVTSLWVIVPIVSLRIHMAPTRLFFDHEGSSEQAPLLASALFSACVIASVLCAGTIALFQVLGLIDPVTRGSLAVQSTVFGLVLVTIGFDFSLSLMRIRGLAVRFAAASLLQGTVMLGVFVGAKNLIPGGFERAIAAFVAGSVTGALVGLLGTYDLLRGGRLSLSLARQAARYSAPTAVHLVSLWLINSAGQWIGVAYLGLAGSAPFVLMTQIIAAMMMVGRALFEARLPEIGVLFARQHYENGARLIRVTMFAGMALVALGYGLAVLLLQMLGDRLPAGYQPTASLLLLAAAVSLADVVYLRGVQLLGALKRTGVQATMTLVAGLCTIALGFSLVEPFGSAGLMWSVVLGVGIQALTSNWAATRCLKQSLAATRAVEK